MDAERSQDNESSNNPTEAEVGSSAAGAQTSPATVDQLPDDLPPVEPPSAGFIMQLFLVPGLIVAAVIGVWALFGQVSASEQDWRQMVTEMRSNNEHRRWRGAQGLAQMLQIDQDLGEQGQKLSTNPQVASELANLLTELLKEKSTDEELVRRQLFLTRTIGWLDSHKEIVPVLVRAMQDKQNEIVRTDAIRVVSIVAGRGLENGQPLKSPELSARLIELSQDTNHLLRQVCAFTLGLLPGDDVDQRLRVLTEDGDWDTCVNAALALSRRHMIDGYPVLIRILKGSGKPVDPQTMQGETEQIRIQRARTQESMNSVAVGNALRALVDIKKVLTDSQQDEAIELVTSVSKDSKILKLRIKATETLRLLETKP